MAGLPAGEPSSDSPGIKYPRVFRTFMPDAGPSAFAVELSPHLALCYDPLRGGVNEVWDGRIDLSPTFQAKINQPAQIVGQVFYREKLSHPLRLADPASAPQHRFKGYRYEKESVIFEFTLRGQLVTETLRANDNGRGLVREWKLPGEAGPVFFTMEDQPGATVEIRGGREVKPGLWQFAEGSRVTFIITPKPANAG